MEKDDEVYGAPSTSYTTEFRQYDSRIGRWLSIDPLAATFPHQSPYCAFNNNPLYWVDPTGQGGEVTADKENKTITVTQKVFFWKNKEGTNNTQISNQEGLVGSLQGDQAGWDASFNVNMSATPDDLSTTDMWTVTYNTEYVPIEASNEGQYNRIAKGMRDSQPTADYLSAFSDANSSLNGDYSNGLGRIRINLAGSLPTAQTYGHERGHSLGLQEASRYPVLGVPAKGPNANGRTDSTGPIMSYAALRSARTAEARLQVQTFFSIIQQSQNTVVRIGLIGGGGAMRAFERK